MFEEVLRGTPPTVEFRKLIASDSTMTNRELAALFYESFPKVDGVAVQHIWHWLSPVKPTGHLVDKELDELLLELLDKAGYGF